MILHKIQPHHTNPAFTFGVIIVNRVKLSSTDNSWSLILAQSGAGKNMIRLLLH